MSGEETDIPTPTTEDDATTRQEVASVAEQVQQFEEPSTLTRGYQSVFNFAGQLLKVGSANLVATTPSSQKKAADTSKVSTMENVDSIRTLLKIKSKNFEKIYSKLQALIGTVEATPEETEVQYNLLTLSREEISQLNQQLVQLLILSKKEDECEEVEEADAELAEKVMTVKVTLSSMKNTRTEVSVGGADTAIECQLLNNASRKLAEQLEFLQNSLDAEEPDDIREQIPLVALRWERYLECYSAHTLILQEKKNITDLESWEERKFSLLEKKTKLERAAREMLHIEDAPPPPPGSPNDQRSFRYNRRDLPKLGGSVKDWLPFWALFQEVDTDKQLTDVQKFQLLLQSTVEGSEPRDIVNGFIVTGKNYKAALKRLEDLYGRENVLIKVYVRELLQLSLEKSMGRKVEFRQLVTQITAQIRNLEMLGVTADKCALVIYPIIEACLPTSTLSLWQQQNSDDLNKLMTFLQQEVNHQLERDLAKFEFQTPSEDKKSKHEAKKGKGSSTGSLSSTAVNFHNKEVKSGNCVFCDNRHASRDCRKSMSMDYAEKEEIVKKKGVCYVCLEPGHISSRCPNREHVQCSICSRNHYKVLCRKSSTSNGGGGGGGSSNHSPNNTNSSEGSPGNHIPNPQQPPPNNPPSHTIGLKNTVQSSEVPLQVLTLTATRVRGKSRLVRALLDSGSQKSYVVEALHQELQFQHTGHEEVVHQLFGGTTTTPQRHDMVKLLVGGADGSAPCTFEVSCVPKISDNIQISGTGPWTEEFRKRGVTFQAPHPSTNIDILIGNDVAPRLYTGRIVDLGTGPVAMETRWGWTLCGKLPQPQQKTKSNMVNITTTLLDLPLTALWDLDSIGIQDDATRQSREELATQTQKHFEETVRRVEEGRYEISLPFLSGAKELLPTNYFAAERRLRATTEKIRQQGFLSQYEELFNQWERDGMIEEVTSTDNVAEGHYLPHRAVVKLSSSTTPIRPVFDASAKPRGKPSLNDCLEKGPNLLELIPSLTTRFRLEKVGFTADIKKAFQQISVTPQHRDYLKFLWWSDPECRKLKVYRHTRVVFGVSSSPFLLGATLKFHLERSPSSHAKTAGKILQSLYVDNVVSSEPNMKQAQQLEQQAKELLAPAQFDLRGWEYGPVEANGKVISILGLKWDTKADTLSLELKPISEKIGEKSSQRVILTIAHMLYDPMGMITPFTIQAKLLLRRCHQMKLGWDKSLPPSLDEDFQKWSSQIPILEEVQIPRYCSWSRSSRRSIHVFSDASSEAYAAVAYLRVETKNEVLINLIQSKSKVAPNGATIPRLELLGCLIACRLAKSIREDLKTPTIETTFWCDSTTALAWITGEGPWNTFVHNRVMEVRENTAVEQWRHVPGRMNPADLPSRGCSASKLVDSRWWEGPTWLYLPEDSWPNVKEEVNQEAVINEKKKTVSNHMLTSRPSPMDEFLKISSYPRMLQAVAMWLRVRANLKHRAIRRKICDNVKVTIPIFITEAERRAAEVVIIRHSQQHLQQDPSRIRRLRPFKDGSGLWRTETRLLQEEEISITPIILCDDNEFVRRIIRNLHEENCHLGTQLLLGKVREQYWLTNGRRAVRKVVRSCWICRRYLAKPMNVEEPPLPITRTAVGVPFNVTGVDMAGPLILRNKSKVWVALFTCASYRAVHLELVDNMSTDEFFIAFRRFAARRGKPSIVYSDNGLNFTGANAALKKVQKSELEKFSQSKRLEWRFNVPTAAWYGGWWERLIGLMKELLRKELGRRVVHRKELEVLLMEVEEALNNRPITYLAEDPEDPIALTPNMLVRNSGLSFFPELNIRDIYSARAAHRRVQKLREKLNIRFKKEYLGALEFQRRRKTTAMLQPGDVVLVHQPNERRQNWPLAVVTGAIPGRDNIVRSYWVKTKAGLISRPAQHLFPMQWAEVPTKEEAED